MLAFEVHFKVTGSIPCYLNDIFLNKIVNALVEKKQVAVVQGQAGRLLRSKIF